MTYDGVKQVYHDWTHRDEGIVDSPRFLDVTALKRDL